MSSSQIVKYDRIPAALRHEFSGVAPDVAGAAGDEDVHESDVITLDLKWPPRAITNRGVDKSPKDS
jgi:hypothetical protein